MAAFSSLLKTRLSAGALLCRPFTSCRVDVQAESGGFVVACSCCDFVLTGASTDQRQLRCACSLPFTAIAASRRQTLQPVIARVPKLAMTPATVLTTQ